MADYIDREKLLGQIEEPMNWTDSEAELQEQADYQAFKNMVEDAPTEDVVPRSEVEVFCTKIMHLEEDYADMVTRYIFAKQEVAREIFVEIKQEIKLALDSNYKAKDEHLKIYKDYDVQFISLVNGKILALRGIDDFLDELKKKYIGKKENKNG